METKAISLAAQLYKNADYSSTTANRMKVARMLCTTSGYDYSCERLPGLGDAPVSVKHFTETLNRMLVSNELAEGTLLVLDDCSYVPKEEIYLLLASISKLIDGGLRVLTLQSGRIIARENANFPVFIVDAMLDYAAGRESLLKSARIRSAKQRKKASVVES